MPWIEATLRGDRVHARALDDGSFVIEGGRVEIRYRPGDSRAYRAAARNLEPVPGARVVADEAFASAPAGDAPARSAPARASRVAAEEAASAGPVWSAFTDGACSGNPGPAGCGVVLIAPDGKMYEGFEYLGSATNNVAELTGILRALEWAPADVRGLVVRTDSQYAIGVLQKGWKAKVNQDLVQRTKRAVQDRGARLVYVPGHSGVAMNERADELAREAITTRRTRTADVD